MNKTAQSKGEEIIKRVWDLKDTPKHIAFEILQEYEALGLQYGRTIEDTYQQEQYFIQLGRKVEYYRGRINNA